MSNSTTLVCREVDELEMSELRLIIGIDHAYYLELVFFCLEFYCNSIKPLIVFIENYRRINIIYTDKITILCMCKVNRFDVYNYQLSLTVF